MQYDEEAPPPSHGALLEDASAMSVQSRRTTDSSSLISISEAQEAEMLSRATSQAMIAARSIILSGGSQSTALCTAKAAANSILVPHTSDGKKFLSRRKAKRQAEIVASMALLSVKQQTMQQPPVTVQQSQQLEASSFMQGCPPALLTPHSHTMSEMGSVQLQPPPRAYNRASPTANSVPPRSSGASTYSHRSPSVPLIPPSPSPYPVSNYNNIRSEPVVGPPAAEEEKIGARNPTTATSNAAGWLRKKIPLSNNNSADRKKNPQQPPAKLPSELPKSKPKNHHHHHHVKTKDLAKSLPEEDPIYYNMSPRQSKFSFYSGESMSGSDSQSDYSGTYGSDTLEELTTIAPATIDRAARRSSSRRNDEDNFLNESVDPMLTTLTNLFFCGGPSYEPEAAASATSETATKTRKQRSREQPEKTESRDDEQEEQAGGLRSGSEAEGEVDGGGGDNNKRQGHRLESRSTDGSAVFKGLNASTDELSEAKPPVKSNIRESMEQVVLRALESALSDTSSRDKHQQAVIPDSSTNNNHNDDRPASAVEVRDPKKEAVNGGISATSSLTSNSTKSRLQALSQRVKFRRWMRRRRGHEETVQELPDNE